MNLSLPLPDLLRPSLAAVLLLLLLQPAVRAQTFWTASDGQWNSNESWSNGLPTNSGLAAIDNGSAVSIPVGVTGNYESLFVGFISNDGTIEVDGGLLSGTSAYLGAFSPGVTGSATVTSGTWNTSNLFIGYSGTGTLTVDGGYVNNLHGLIGMAEGSHGSATVTSGTWNTSDLFIGYSGTGTLTVDGGYVNNLYGWIGVAEGSHGNATVTSGTWQNTSHLSVGVLGTGTLTVDGGYVNNLNGLIGQDEGSHGNATVTSGTWQNTSNLIVGADGTGTLNILGGLVQVSGTTLIGQYSSGTGTINLLGDEITRGVLQTGVLMKGDTSVTFGTGKLNFDGGILRAGGNSADFIVQYAAGDITIGTGGAYLDTNGFTVGVNAPLGGTGALHKIGEGTLTLSGSSSYEGGTVVEQGTLTAGHDHAVGTGAVTIQSGGTFTIQIGVTLANIIKLEGGRLNRGVAKDASLAGTLNASTTLGGGTTHGQLLDGTASEATTLQASFSGSSTAINDEIRVGGVLTLSGVHVIDAGTGQTDQFVLQLAVEGLTTGYFLGWLDTTTNLWVNAVDGNVGGTSTFLGNHAYNAATDFVLGNYGFDALNGTVWAVLNHNSDFAAIAVPEPGTWALLAMGAGALLHQRARRRNR